MALSKTERQGIVMGQHPANSPENDSAFFKAGAADGCAVASSISSNSSCKLELLIGDMAIRIDAPLSHMGSYNLSIPLLTGGAVTSPPALYDDNVKPITVEAGEAASQAVTFVPLVQDQEIGEELLPSLMHLQELEH
jgi:hypothetical protein